MWILKSSLFLFLRKKYALSSISKIGTSILHKLFTKARAHVLSTYVDETRNLQSRIDEHQDTLKLSEPDILHNLHSGTFLHLETYCLHLILDLMPQCWILLIAKLCPNLNKQVKAFTLSQFAMGIT